MNSDRTRSETQATREPEPHESYGPRHKTQEDRDNDSYRKRLEVAEVLADAIDMLSRAQLVRVLAEHGQHSTSPGLLELRSLLRRCEKELPDQIDLRVLEVRHG